MRLRIGNGARIRMETKIVTIGRLDSPESIEEKLAEAGNLVKQGGLVAFPTETVYGLGGDALNPDSSRKIYAAKGRPSDNPLIIHIAELEDLDRIVREIPEKAKKLASAFWPGPLTMIYRKSAIVPYETTGGLDTVAVRMPSHPPAFLIKSFASGWLGIRTATVSSPPVVSYGTIADFL